jgi:hypothetical protein
LVLRLQQKDPRWRVQPAFHVKQAAMLLFIASGKVPTACNGEANKLLARLFRHTLPSGHTGEKPVRHVRP